MDTLTLAFMGYRQISGNGKCHLLHHHPQLSLKESHSRLAGKRRVIKVIYLHAINFGNDLQRVNFFKKLVDVRLQHRTQHAARFSNHFAVADISVYM